MNFNSPLVQFALRFGLSKGGIIITAAVSWLITHIGLRAFVSADQLKQIQDGLDAGGMALLAAAYAWLTHRQQAGVKVLQTQLNVSPISSPTVKVDGIVGNQTLDAAARVTGVKIEKAQALAANGLRF